MNVVKKQSSTFIKVATLIDTEAGYSIKVICMPK